MPRRARSGTAYNKAPLPPDSDDDDIIWAAGKGAGKGVQFEDAQSALGHDLFGPGGQEEKKKKGWQRRRSGTAFNRSPPPPEEDDEDFNAAVPTLDDDKFLALAVAEAERGFAEGGVPIGAVLVSADGHVLGRGCNQRVQQGNPILHGETAAFQDAGRLPARVLRGCTMYTTLSPCAMCSGTMLLYNIPRVVIAENTTFMGEEVLLRSRGVEVVVKHDATAKALMDEFIKQRPEIWWEDIGEEDGKTAAIAAASVAKYPDIVSGEGGGGNQVRFQANPNAQPPSRMPRRARSGTAYNKAPPPPDSDDDDDEVDIWTGTGKGVQFEDVQSALTHDLFGPGGQAEKKKKGWQRRRSGTAFNRAPPPESSDEDEDDEGGGEHQVRFQADPASQSPSRMPRRARSGTAFNRAPPPPEDNEEEYDAVSSSADSTESSDDEDGDQGNTDKGGSSIAAQPSDAVQRTLPRIGSRLFNNAFA